MIDEACFVEPFLLLFCSPPLQSLAQAGTCAGMTLGQNSSLNGFIPFPTTDPWRQDVTAAAVDPNSASIISFIGGTVPLHPDFGSGQIGKSTIGIPYQVVSVTPTVAIAYTASASESDPGPMPIPVGALIEGYPKAGGAGDKHVLVLDRDNCFLYELYNSKLQTDGSWKAGSGAVWDLNNNSQRPYTWTSADAAGLPIFPGLARYDEVANGVINHAPVSHSPPAWPRSCRRQNIGLQTQPIRMLHQWACGFACTLASTSPHTLLRRRSFSLH